MGGKVCRQGRTSDECVGSDEASGNTETDRDQIAFFVKYVAVRGLELISLIQVSAEFDLNTRSRSDHDDRIVSVVRRSPWSSKR